MVIELFLIMLKSGINYNLEWTLQGWANVNMRGDYHNLITIPFWLSGTLVSVPDQVKLMYLDRSKSLCYSF